MATDNTYFAPVLPSFDGFFDALDKTAKKGGEQAGKTLGDSLGKSLERSQGAVDKATKTMERAHSRAADAADNTRIAELKLAEVMEKGNAKASEIATATARLDKARRNQEAADKAAARSSDLLADAQQDLAKKTDEASNSLEIAADKGEGFNISMKDAALGIGAFVTAAAGVGAGLVAIGTQFDDMYDTIRVGTGASGDAFAGLQDSARAVAAEIPAMDGGFEQIGTTLADLNTRLGLTGEPLETMTSQFLQLQNMGIDADINDVTGALTQFGVSAEDAPASLDMLFQISQATGRTITELTGNLSKSGPALQEFGFGLEESAGLLGALDKAGLDSEKTLGSMTKALGEFAKDGKDPQEALWGTIASIDELTAAGKNAEAIDLANSIFGAKGGAGFVAAVESGKFEYDDFLDSIGATEDTILGVASETADFAESWQVFKQRAMLAVEPVAMMLFDQLAPAIEKGSEKFEDLVGWVTDDLIPAMQDLGAWFQRNEGWIKPLAVTVGVLTAGYVALAAQQSIMAAGGFLKWMTSLSAITKIQTGAQAALNVVMAANPIALVAIAVAGLVAGLTYFFMKTETGQAIWESFTTALGAGWDWVVEKLSAGWAWLRENVFVSWDTAVAGIKASWQYTVDTVSAAWTWLTSALSAGWETIKTAVFDAWNWYVAQVQANWTLITNALVFAWNWVKDMFIGTWTVIKTAVFDAWNIAVNTVQTVFSTVTGALSASWTWLKDQLYAGFVWVKSNVLDALTSSLDTVKGWFDKTVDAIGTTWDKLKALTAKPVRFVVETVYGGIRNAWNKVAGLVGLGELPEVGLGELGNYARGGVLPGYTPGRDVHEFYSPTGGRIHLSGGEAIMRPEWVRSVGGPSAVDEMNRAAREGKTLAAGPHDHYALGGVWDLGAFANGGTLRKNPGVVLTTDIQRSMERSVAAAFPNQIITSATRYQEMGSGYDNHMAGRALDFAASHALADWIARTYPHSAELFWDPGPNLKNGRPTGAIGGHSDHVHWAMASMVDPYTGEVVSQDGPGGGGGFSLLGMAKGMWDKAIGAIGKFPGAETMGTIGKLPAAALSTLATGAWNFLKEKFAAVGSFFGGGGGDVEQWRDLARAALSRHGYNPDDHIEAMLQQIDIESSGNPGAVNNWDPNAVNGTPSGGLLQVIEPTYRDVRNRWPEAFEGLPDDRMHPATNLVAGVGAVRRDWGGPAGRWPTRGGYHNGGLAPAGQGMMPKTAMEPEMVLNPRMTEAFIDWMKVVPGSESAQVMAREISRAFHGEDWGMGELAAVLGDKRVAQAIIDGAAALGRADRGFREWAAGDEERARMGTPEEWARHYGAQAGVDVADDVLGLFGLGGFAGGKFKDSFVDMINAGADVSNDVYGTQFGHMRGDMLQARAVIDDEGRVIEVSPTSAPVAVAEPVAAAPVTSAVSDSAVGATGGAGTTIIEVEGGKVYGADDLVKLNEHLGDVEFRVKKIEDDSIAPPGAGVGLI